MSKPVSAPVLAPVPVTPPITPALAASSSKSAAPVRLPPPVPTPVAVPAPVAPSSAAYFWIDQADGFADVIGNSPPDFAFRQNGVESWAWVSRVGETLIVEPGRDGVIQYYFTPRATAPYLVRDSYYSYGFDGPELVQVYDNNGRIPRAWPTSGQRSDGDDLQRRGRALLSASWRQRQWDSAAAQSWQRQQGYAFDVFGGRDSGWNSGWRDEWRAQPDWSAFERAERSRRPARRLEDERRDRRDAGYRFDQWHRSGARGAPPLPANPIVVPTATPIVSPAPVAPASQPAPAVVRQPDARTAAPVTAPPSPPRRAWIEPAAPPTALQPAPLAVPAALPTSQPVIAPAPVIAVPEVRPLPAPDPAIAAEAERRRAEAAAAAAEAAARARAEAEAAQAQAAAARAEAEAAQAQAAAAQAQAEAAALEARRAAEARAQAEAAARAQAEAAAAKPAEPAEQPARPLGENEREQ